MSKKKEILEYIKSYINEKDIPQQFVRLERQLVSSLHRQYPFIW